MKGVKSRLKKQVIDNSITFCHTYSMKTAISVPDDLFKEVEEIAKEQHSSRSALFTIAVKEYLERIKSQRLLDALNKAYSEPELSEDKALRQRSKKYYARKILKEHY